MAKTKEEIKAYVLSQNWGKMWIKNIELHSNRVVGLPNNLESHLDKMFASFLGAIGGWITSNAVKIRETRQGSEYWHCIANAYRYWYRS